MLSLGECKKIQSLAALKNNKHLQKLILPEHISDIDFLRDLPSLEYIAYSGDLETLDQTSAQFWEKRKQKNE